MGREWMLTCEEGNGCVRLSNWMTGADVGFWWLWMSGRDVEWLLT